jgi:response regulator of citrate/malate metabolism
MDPFVLVILGGIVALILWVVFLGRFYPGSGMDQIGWKSAREMSENREELEAEDLDQMLAASNARRRARGLPERTVEELELRVIEDRQEMTRRREALMADRDLDELLEATNARRRARGLPERTLAEVRAEFGGGPPPSAGE